MKADARVRAISFSREPTSIGDRLADTRLKPNPVAKLTIEIDVFEHGLTMKEANQIAPTLIDAFNKALREHRGAAKGRLSPASIRALDYLKTRGGTGITPGIFADAMGYGGLRRHGQVGARVLEGLKRRGFVEGFVPRQGEIWHYRISSKGLQALKG